MKRKEQTNISVVVAGPLPACDICACDNTSQSQTAAYDGKTHMGPWAYMCEACFKRHGVGLGLGRGQRFLPADVEL